MFDKKKMEELKKIKDSIVKNADKTVGSALNKAIDYKKERDAKKEAEIERLKQEQAEQFRKAKDFLVKYKKILIPLVILGIGGSCFSIYWSDKYGDDGYRQISRDIHYYLSKPYEKVVDDFKLSGFDNIVLKEINEDKGVSDIETNDVVDISIDGVSGISTEAKYKKDAKVEVSYYVQPEKKEEPKQDVVEEKTEDVKVESEKINTPSKKDPVFLDVDPEYLNILQKNASDPEVQKFFVSKYGDEVIITGTIRAVQNYGTESNPSYDIVFSSMAWSEGKPLFAFSRINPSSYGIKNQDIAIGNTFVIQGFIGLAIPDGIVIINPVTITK